MRFAVSLLLLLLAALCLAQSYGQPLEEEEAVQDNEKTSLLSLADQGALHASEGAREERAFCCGGYRRGGYWGGGYRRGGYWGGGYRRGGYWGGGYRRGGYGRGYGWGR